MELELEEDEDEDEEKEAEGTIRGQWIFESRFRVKGM